MTDKLAILNDPQFVHHMYDEWLYLGLNGFLHPGEIFARFIMAMANSRGQTTRRSRHRRIPVLMGGRAFLPSDIVGLQLWLDANDSSTLFQDAAKTTAAGDGDVVGAWADKSGQGNDATQATTAAKPILHTGVVNGRPIARFDGTDDTLEIGDLSALTAAEIFIVVKVDADPPPNVNKTGLWNFSTSLVATHFPLNTDGKIYDDFGTDTRKTTVNPATSLAQFNIYNVVSISGEWTSRLNNTQLFTTGVNTVSLGAGNFLGKSFDPPATSFWLDGDIAECILYDSKLSDSNRALINNYLANRYGITIS